VKGGSDVSAHLHATKNRDNLPLTYIGGHALGYLAEVL
jgi:hypothetical protein